jgi:hypothetical protein
MGERIKGEIDNLTKTRNFDSWIGAQETIRETVAQIGINFAVAGSVAYSAISKQDLHPHDLDILLMCPDQQKREFGTVIRSRWLKEFPELDLCSLIYFGSLDFLPNGEAVLIYKNIKIPVDSSVFTTHEAYFFGMGFPVLHPETYIQLMKAGPHSPKADRGIAVLDNAVQQGATQGLTNPNVSSLVEFDRMVKKNLALSIRQKLDRLEGEGNDGLVIKAKRYIRDQQPGVAKVLRKILS